MQSAIARGTVPRTKALRQWLLTAGSGSDRMLVVDSLLSAVVGDRVGRGLGRIGNAGRVARQVDSRILFTESPPRLCEEGLAPDDGSSRRSST
jgi:hypothetical protein